jgi:hypothetical protein
MSKESWEMSDKTVDLLLRLSRQASTRGDRYWRLYKRGSSRARANQYYEGVSDAWHHVSEWLAARAMRVRAEAKGEQ